MAARGENSATHPLAFVYGLIYRMDDVRHHCFSTSLLGMRQEMMKEIWEGTDLGFGNGKGELLCCKICSGELILFHFTNGNMIY